MSFDYSMLSSTDSSIAKTWEELYDSDFTLPENLDIIIRSSVYLPHDHYDIIAAYFLLPSALCNVVPYLFINGASGSGKSTLAKIAKHLHGVDFNSSSDTFAGIRNDLNQRRTHYIELPVTGEPGRTYNKQVEKNTMMVWDDVDASVFVNNPDLYRLFKFGYDRTTDKITISSKETGTNMIFHCFCPKVFSTITPLHLDARFKELKRRLIVIPCRSIEELPEKRLVELGISTDSWQQHLINVDAYSWQGFSDLFQNYWNLDKASEFIKARIEVNNSFVGLSSTQLAICRDLIACGVTTGIWSDLKEAADKLKAYFKWLKSETTTTGGLDQMLKEYLEGEVKNLKAADMPLEISQSNLLYQIKTWVAMNWLMEQPRGKEVSNVLFDLGWKFKKGVWVKE